MRGRDIVINGKKFKTIFEVNAIGDLEPGEVAKPEQGTVYYLRDLLTREIVSDGGKLEVQAIERHAHTLEARCIGSRKRWVIAVDDPKLKPLVTCLLVANKVC